MADGKWISGLTASMPIVEAARRVLSARLQVVGEYLPLAVHESDRDSEHVHQLRVGTRRAGAALKIFAQCLPDKTFRKARKRLRQIRRAAGKARDWDVFLEHLAAWQLGQREINLPGVDCLTGYALAQRVVAQDDLIAAADQTAPRAAFDRHMDTTLAALQPPESDPPLRQFADLARPLLSQLLRDLDQAAARDLNDYDNLHQVRIAGKWLRYAMEIFVECFPPSFKEKLYPAVEEMQEVLGHANDSHVASQRLNDIRAKLRQRMPEQWKRLKPGIEALLRFHQRRLPQERKRFQKWWAGWEKSGNEAVLRRLLENPEEIRAQLVN